ncbi:MAG: potassium channel family protein [Pseudomonadota bacterium]
MTDDSNKYWGLLVSLMAMLLIGPILDSLARLSLLVELIFGALLIFAVWTISHRRRTTLIATILAVLLFAANGLITAGNVSAALNVATMILGCAFFSYVASLIFYDTFYCETVTLDTVLGAICVYLMMGLFWGYAYGFVDLMDPSAFDQISNDGHLLNRFMYFSFVTLTTLGYGDISPTSDAARGLAILEATTGQIYLTVLVGRLVGLHLANHQGATSRR